MLKRATMLLRLVVSSDTDVFSVCRLLDALASFFPWLSPSVYVLLVFCSTLFSKLMKKIFATRVAYTTHRARTRYNSKKDLD